MSLSDEFLGTDVQPSWVDDARLVALQDCIDLIHDVRIKALVAFTLSKADCFWTAPVSNFSDGSYPPDEYEAGGIVRNTRRAVKAFWYLHHCMDFTVDEYYCGVAALLIRNVTKAVYIGEDHKHIAHDPFYLYTVDAFIQAIMDESRDNAEDNGRVLGIADEQINLIMRLVRTSDGTLSMIPETYPVTPLELTVHMATLMGRACHELLLNVDEAAYDGTE